MPTPIPALEKSGVLDIIKVLDPIEADKLNTILNDYEDVTTMVGRSLPVFEYKNTYLKEVLQPLNNNQLQIVGIFKESNGPINNDPKLIHNFTVTGGATTITQNNASLAILGDSDVDKITIAAGVTLKYLWIGPGAKLRVLDATAAGCFVQNIFIRNLRNAPAELTSIAFGSNVNANGIEVDNGAIFGGFTNNDPTAACANPVTNLQATDETMNTIKLSWTAPAAGTYILINVFFKKSESAEWLLASEADGDFITDGFIFRKLQPNTKYDFKVDVTCLNGGVASTPISEITTCCQ